ncbi:hypothetical protein HYU06_06100 [Candidatus Woesearchaeota archaeon]|nr:hypothetical protein [Candidatus Woesearchaeota archaeon]
MPTQAEIQNRILKDINHGVNRLGTSLDRDEKSRIKSFLAARNSAGANIGSHDQFVNLVVNKPDDFRGQFVSHLQQENNISLEEAEKLFEKLFAHATNEFKESMERARIQQEQARQEQLKVQQKFSGDIQTWHDSFEQNVDNHLEKHEEKLDNITEQELRNAKNLAMQNLRIEELQKQLGRIQDPAIREQAFAKIMNKKIGEQLKLLRGQAQQNREQDRSDQQNLSGFLKTDVTAAVNEKLNRASERLDKAAQSMKEYFPTFTRWGQRAGVVGANAVNAGGRAAVDTAVTAGMISAALAKSAASGVKKQTDKFSDGFFDIVLILGILLHVIQGMTGGWQGPSAVAYKWAFIFLIIYSIILLGAPNSLSLRFRTFSIVIVFFIIEWQWFRIVKLIGIQTQWWALKALWPTVVWYWVFKSIVNEGKKPIMTWMAIIMISGFWVTLGYSAINAGAFIEKYTPEGLSQEEYAQQKTGVWITLAEELGYDDVSEFEIAAAERCKEQGYYTDYYLERGKVKMLTAFIGERYKECLGQEVKRLAEAKKEKNEIERVIAAREIEMENDFTEVNLREEPQDPVPNPDPPEMIKNKKTVKSVNAVVEYNIRYKSAYAEAELTFAAMLKNKTSKKEELTMKEGIPADIICRSTPGIACPKDQGKVVFSNDDLKKYKTEFEFGVDISAGDIAKNGINVFVTGENTLRAAVIFTDKTKTILPVVLTTEDAIRSIKKTVEYDEETANSNLDYEFNYWNKLIAKNALPINLASTYPFGKVEGFHGSHPAIIDIKLPTYEKPVIVIGENTQLTWKIDIFNSEKYKEGKIVGINNIILYLPQGIEPVTDICPFERAKERDKKDNNRVLKLAYQLKKEYIAELQKPERLIGLSDVKDIAATGIPRCTTSIDKNKLFGRDAQNLNLKQKFINKEIMIEMEYTYAIFKDTKVNIGYEIDPDLRIGNNDIT